MHFKEHKKKWKVTRGRRVRRKNILEQDRGGIQTSWVRRMKDPAKMPVLNWLLISITILWLQTWVSRIRWHSSVGILSAVLGEQEWNSARKSIVHQWWSQGNTMSRKNSDGLLRKNQTNPMAKLGLHLVSCPLQTGLKFWKKVTVRQWFKLSQENMMRRKKNEVY